MMLTPGTPRSPEPAKPTSGRWWAKAALVLCVVSLTIGVTGLLAPTVRLCMYLPEGLIFPPWVDSEPDPSGGLTFDMATPMLLGTLALGLLLPTTLVFSLIAARRTRGWWQILSLLPMALALLGAILLVAVNLFGTKAIWLVTP